MSTTTAEQVRSFLVTLFDSQFGRRGYCLRTVPDNCDLLEEGIVDSLGVLEMVEAVQSAFDVDIDAEEMVDDELTTLGPFCRFVERKCAAGDEHNRNVSTSPRTARRQALGVVSAEEVKHFLCELFSQKLELLGGSGEALPYNLDLLEAGIVDSLEIHEMIEAIQSQFNVELESEDLACSRLTVVGNLCSLIEERTRRDVNRTTSYRNAETNLHLAPAMNIVEALDVTNRKAPMGASLFRTVLACGFTPLHLETFFTAHLRRVLPHYRVETNVGLYGDLLGTIETVKGEDADAIAIVLEWQELDPRLGVRSLGGWGRKILPDIVDSVRNRLERLLVGLRKLSPTPVALVLPTLPQPPLASFTPEQLNIFQLELQNAILSFASSTSGMHNVRVANPQYLDGLSAAGERFDVKSEIAIGFPYFLAHAEVIGRVLARLICPTNLRKGLITDLDDTLWRGILGEVGRDGVFWDLEHNAQVHGLYQQTLASLAESGTFIAAASKNDPTLVNLTFQRPDLLIKGTSIFPVEASWEPKSKAVARILQAWNIAADSVVFVDDSAMEVAEVKSVFPAMECIVFPNRDPQEVWSLLHYLKSEFGKMTISSEDEIRSESIRAGKKFLETANTSATVDDFLSTVEARLTLNCNKRPSVRALELINKTHQFNLNGASITEGQWNAYLADPDTFVMTVAYTDKFGPLGTIALIAGRYASSCLTIDHWSMSCRAFSRRIEHACMQWLFDRYDLQELALRFEITERNGVMQDFLTSIATDRSDGQIKISRQRFLERCPRLFHRIDQHHVELFENTDQNPLGFVPEQFASTK